MLGKLDHLFLPDLGKPIGQGEYFWSVDHKYGNLEFASPLEGIVDTVNYNLLEKPDLLTGDPYGDGWLMMIEPENIGKTIGNTFQGSEADVWMAEESIVLNSTVHNSTIMTMHDGAVASENISENIEKNEWLKLAKNHLPLLICRRRKKYPVYL